MLFSTAGQAHIFLVTVALGAAMGLVHDGVELIYLLFPARALRWLLESLFFALCVYAAFSVLLRVNAGELRAYTVLGMGVGWCLYLLSLGQLFRKIAAFLGSLPKRLRKNRITGQFFR
ncbi:MAG: spore cortex biosynthesis protein YabQ [Christensenellaceae bacterium]|nr:spore cortex biosynthesis protein YabQ [Christensenellaceae bacterium]